MKNHMLHLTRVALAALCLMSTTSLIAASADKPVSVDEVASKVGFVNFRKCVEESKLGKQQQTAFEAMQNQMEASLTELQKSLNDITTKLSDEDYVDGLSPAAENELKHKYRALSQELARTQGQYVQTLQDANVKIIQSLSSEVAEAAKEVAKARNLDLVVNEEAVFFYRPSFDISSHVVAQMDAKFEKEQKSAMTPSSNSGKPPGRDTGNTLNTNSKK